MDESPLPLRIHYDIWQSARSPKDRRQTNSILALSTKLKATKTFQRQGRGMQVNSRITKVDNTMHPRQNDTRSRRVTLTAKIAHETKSKLMYFLSSKQGCFLLDRQKIYMGLVETLYNTRSISNQTPSLESSV